MFPVQQAAWELLIQCKSICLFKVSVQDGNVYHPAVPTMGVQVTVDNKKVNQLLSEQSRNLLLTANESINGLKDDAEEPNKFSNNRIGRLAKSGSDLNQPTK